MARLSAMGLVLFKKLKIIKTLPLASAPTKN
jgi:hypothetical protein